MGRSNIAVPSIYKEVHAKGMPDTKPEPIEDCDGTICKKVYGSGLGKKYWCKKCSLVLELASEVRKEPKVCPECGLSVHNLTAHLTNKHYKETHLCRYVTRYSTQIIQE